MNHQYTYRVHYSVEDNEWIATCDQEPSMSYLHEDPTIALSGLLWVMDDSSPSLKEQE